MSSSQLELCVFSLKVSGKPACSSRSAAQFVTNIRALPSTGWSAVMLLSSFLLLPHLYCEQLWLTACCHTENFTSASSSSTIHLYSLICSFKDLSAPDCVLVSFTFRPSSNHQHFCVWGGVTLFKHHSLYLKTTKIARISKKQTTTTAMISPVQTLPVTLVSLFTSGVWIILGAWDVSVATLCGSETVSLQPL